jgi:hypothetical protein
VSGARSGHDLAEEAGSPEYPALHRSFDISSAMSQRRFVLLTRVSLIATVVAAVGGAVSVTRGTDWAAVAALVAFLGAGGCRLVLLREHPERAWYDSRAGAESVKTLAWQYAVGGGPFPLARGDDEAVRRDLTERYRDLLKATRGLTRPPGQNERQVTDWMTRLRSTPLEHRSQIYLDDRLGDQIRWYGTSATRQEGLARRWSVATMALQAAGALAAILRVTGTIDVDLMGVAAAAAAASTAWLESRDHSSLAEAYATTAHELALARDDLPDVLHEAGWAIFVGDTEAAISREHTSWLARRRAQSARSGLGD